MTLSATQRLERKNGFDGSLVYGTGRFNAKTGRNTHVEQAAKIQTEYFIDPRRNALHRRMMELRACPVCGARKAHDLFVKDGFHHQKCPCGFIYVNPTAKDKFRNHFFSEIYHTWTSVLLSPEQELIDRRKFAYALDLINEVAPRRGKLVDIGAGSGLFLDVARESGWQVSGVEFNQKAVAAMRQRGLEVFDRALEDGIYASASVDVAALWEVLEHINDPNTFLRQVRRILKPKGLLFVCVPNIGSLATRLLHEKARTFGGSSHVNFFSIDTLSRLLKKQGFEVLQAETAISELGTIRNHLDFEEPYSGDSALSLEFLTPKYLYDHDLGSRILLLARRRGR